MALNFNPSGYIHWVDSGAGASLNITQNLTLLVRIFGNVGNTGYGDFLSKDSSPATDPYRQYTFSLDTNKKLEFKADLSGTWTDVIVADAALPDGTKTIGATYETGVGAKLYQDGALIKSSGTYTAAIGSHPTWKLAIANNNYGSDPERIDYSIRAIISEVRIYNRILSPNEMFAFHHGQGADNIVNGLALWYRFDENHAGAVASSIIDLSGNGNTGTPKNSVAYAEAPYRKRGGMSI